MTTELGKFKEAYATMVVATYEPLILRWISGWTLRTVAGTVAKRMARADVMSRAAGVSTAIQVASVQSAIRGRRLPPESVLSDIIKNSREGQATHLEEDAVAGVAKLDITGFPRAVLYRGIIHPNGLTMQVTEAQKRRQESAADAEDIPTFVSGLAETRDLGFDLKGAQKNVYEKMMVAAREAEPGQLGALLNKHLKDIGLYNFFPELKVEEALSPIGIAHFYRQLYFNADEGFGPIEQAFTVAPLETLEVVYETVRKQIHEEVLEMGLEQVSEAATETKNTDEVSDKVSSMIQRDTSAAMSASTSGSIGVWQASASVSASFKNAGQRSREQTSRRLKEVTTRAAERITKTFKLTTRDVDELTTTNLTRRIIRNDSASPVSYGLRRVLRRVRVKVQDLGPRLVWQLYVRTPGKGLARSKFVHFRESGPITVPNEPPGLPPRPIGGTDTGSTSSSIKYGSTYYVTLVVQPGADRKVTSVSIDSITDLEGGGKDDLAPSPRNDNQWGPGWDASGSKFTKHIAILPGDSASVSISYTYAWEPADSVVAAWDKKRQEAVLAISEEQLSTKFAREKALITERSKIKARPAADLRKEERYEVMNRMVSHLFAHTNQGQDPSPLEIEFFHRFFDIEAMFTYTHPSWWKPRYTPIATGMERPAYEITAESEPAPLGASLGWMIQLDGDDRRNEFINSPWVRVCLPIYPGREREAIEWLSKHIEGADGYDIHSGPLGDLLGQVEQYRGQEEKLGINGADYVTVDSTIGDESGDPTGPLKPENIYPVVQEYEVTVPTEGFVYDELKLV